MWSLVEIDLKWAEWGVFSWIIELSNEVRDECLLQYKFKYSDQ